MARVSIIIPTHNRADLLVRALDSALNQTRVPDEIIVVDDCSTDDTGELLQKYRPPVRAIRHKANRGVSAARNTGIEQSTGDLICFLDSDDTLLPESIERRAAWLETHAEDGIVYGYIERIDFEGNLITVGSIPPPWPSGNILPHITRYDFPIHAWMIRRSHLPSPPYFDESLVFAEDWLFTLRMAAAHPVRYVDVKAGQYRFHPGMTMSGFRQAHPNVITVQEYLCNMPAFRALPPQQQARAHCGHAMSRMLGGHMAKARVSLRRSMQTVPGYWLAYPLWAMSWLGRGPVSAVFELRQRLVAWRRWGRPQ